MKSRPASFSVAIAFDIFATHESAVLGLDDPPQKVKVGNYTLEATYLGSRRVGPSATAPEPPLRAGAIFIATGPDEFFAAGNGVTVTFSPNPPGASVRRTGQRGRKHFCERPLGSRYPAGRR
jgi:hypothetical protein